MTNVRAPRCITVARLIHKGHLLMITHLLARAQTIGEQEHWGGRVPPRPSTPRKRSIVVV